MKDWLAPKYVDWLWQGFALTLGLSVSVIIVATCLGFGLALGRNSSSPVLRRAAALYVLIFRNSPLLVQLLFLYFGVATLLPDAAVTWLNSPHRISLGPIHLHWPAFEFVAGFIGLTLYSTTFVGEEFRAGLRGVPISQYQAASALGLTPFATFKHVVLPQAVRKALPSLFGQYMNIVKNSSLTMSIGLAELSYSARQVDTETFKTFQAFGAATILYIATIAVLETLLLLIQHRNKHKMARG